MPTYPSSLYPVRGGSGVTAAARSGIAFTNDAGSYFFNNSVNYQEFKNQVVGLGISTGQASFQALDANDLANAGTTYNSAAKYPTDLRAGTAPLGVIGSSYSTDSFADFITILTNFAAAGFAYTTAIGACSDAEKKIAQSFTGKSYFNLQSKIEKVTFELNRMVADLTGLGAESSTSNLQSTARYPSSLNRFTNTAGGI